MRGGGRGEGGRGTNDDKNSSQSNPMGNDECTRFSEVPRRGRLFSYCFLFCFSIHDVKWRTLRTGEKVCYRTFQGCGQ